MLLMTKYVDGLPLHHFEKVLGRYGIDIPRQSSAGLTGQEVVTRLLDGYRGYVMKDDYAGYTALDALAGVECLRGQPFLE